VRSHLKGSRGTSAAPRSRGGDETKWALKTTDVYVATVVGVLLASAPRRRSSYSGSTTSTSAPSLSIGFDVAQVRGVAAPVDHISVRPLDG